VSTVCTHFNKMALACVLCVPFSRKTPFRVYRVYRFCENRPPVSTHWLQSAPGEYHERSHSFLDSPRCLECMD
jgi:hypothetical protein